MVENNKKYTKEELKTIANYLVEKYTIMEREGREILINKVKSSFSSIELGTFVAIRSCREQDSDILMLGVYLGMACLDPNPTLSINPAFYVFGLKDIILGMESWWNAIKEDDLNLSCDAIKIKNNFTWNDINDTVNRWMQTVEYLSIINKNLKRGYFNARSIFRNGLFRS